MSANQETVLKTGKFEWDNKAVLKTFNQAADLFVKKVGGSVQIWAASRDWFLHEYGRDSFVSLPGILLTRKKFKEAKQVFERFAKFQKNGIIPNIIQKECAEYNSVDASLWFVHAMKKYHEYTNDSEFVKKMLPTMKSVIDSYKKGTFYKRCGKRQNIWMDDDGFLVSPAQATWMDADCFGKAEPITPRNGKAVEINVLWYEALKFLSNFDNNHVYLTENIRASFSKKFWNKSQRCLMDVVDGDPYGWSVRPNMIFAVNDDLLSKMRQKQVLKKVEEELLTPGGLRTLSPKDHRYIGTYDTSLPIEEKDKAYHQGTAWPWLMGGYCDALAKLGREKEIKEVLTPLVRFCLESPYKSLPEVFSGNSPYEPGGTTSQAWSVAEVLRILVENKIV
ncbi:MAG: hypothetical protein JW700_02475 [Candidatus Aenigmarchaeota archaeon]|nr:hypothetical protein [Candidatus Aenigmarchaeota archaeon]